MKYIPVEHQNICQVCVLVVFFFVFLFFNIEKENTKLVVFIDCISQ